MRILRDVLAGNTSFLSRVPGLILGGTLWFSDTFSLIKRFIEILDLVYPFKNVIGHRENEIKMKVAFSLFQ